MANQNQTGPLHDIGDAHELRDELFHHIAMVLGHSKKDISDAERSHYFLYMLMGAAIEQAYILLHREGFTREDVVRLCREHIDEEYQKIIFRYGR